MSFMKFESLNEDVEDLLDKVSARLQLGISKNESAEERKRIINSLEKSLEEVKSSLNKMETECLHAPSKHKPMMTAKIKNYSSEFARHTKKLNEERYANVVGSRQNISDNYDNFHDVNAQLRQQVLIGTSSLERTAESLARSHTIAVETEQIGTDVLGELGTQRATLERARDSLGNTQEEISRSKKILKAMGRNIFYNKVLLIIIIMLEVFILGGLVYWKFFS